MLTAKMLFNASNNLMFTFHAIVGISSNVDTSAGQNVLFFVQFHRLRILVLVHARGTRNPARFSPSLLKD